MFAPGEYERFIGETTGARRVAFDRLTGQIDSRGTTAWNERDLQIESQALGPVELGRTLELHPVAVTASLTAGAALGGVLGAAAAGPVTAASWAVVRALRPDTEMPRLMGDPVPGIGEPVQPEAQAAALGHPVDQATDGAVPEPVAPARLATET